MPNPSYVLRLGIALVVAHLSTLTQVSGQVSVLTNRYNNSRTGANLQETILNSVNVNPGQFGKLYTYPVDGSLYAQPLYMPALTIPGKGTHNVIFLATMNDKVYAYDADTPAQPPLWFRDFTNPPGVIAIPYQNLTGSVGGNISGNVGIESTPVIDPGTGTMYMVARTQEGPNFVQRLHALDVTTGAEKFGGPVQIQGSVPGSAVDSSAGVLQFNPKLENQRSSLALTNGVVLIAWASHEDIKPWHGWVMGYNASTLAQTGVFCTTPDRMGGGIWQAGRAPVIDSDGYAYYETGNGDWDGVRSFGDSILKLQVSTSGMALVDWFTVGDQAFAASQDLDVGSTGTLLVPNTNTLIGGSKESYFYLLNSQNMGRYNPTDSQIIQKLGINGGEMQAGTAFWNSASAGGLVYSWAETDRLKAFHFNGTTLDPTPVALGPTGSSTAPGGMLSVSANGNADASGVVWAAIKTNPDVFGDNQTTPGMLRAYRATNLTEIWNSEQNPGRDRLGIFVKFVVPVVANGKVYAVGYDNQLSVYGLLPAPDFSLGANPSSSTVVQGNAVTISVSAGALNGFTGAVSLQVSGYPAGVSAAFTPTILSSGGSASLALNVGASAAIGTYPLTVTGVSGALSHSIQIYLTITSGVGPPVYGNGYAHRRTITINHANVANTDQIGFPVWVSLADPLLKAAANAGHVNNTNGYDIVFSADPNGAGPNLRHEVEQYSGAAGTLTAWVNIPLLSHTNDTAFYLFYGNPNVTVSQENRPGVWDNNFAGVWHLGNAADSTASNNSGVPGSGATAGVTGVMGKATAFDGSVNAFMDMGTASTLDMSGAFTLSAWIRKTAYTGGYEAIGSKCGATACNYELALDSAAHDLEGVQNGIVAESGAIPSLGAWHYAVEVSDGVHMSFYLDGAPAGTALIGTGSTIPGTHFNLGREQISGENFSGLLDEARLSRIVRPADWILTEYRNQSNPGGFLTAGSEDGQIAPPPADFTITANPSAATVTQGGSANFSLSVGASNGFSGLVSLQVGGYPAGVTASLTPTVVTGGGTAALALSVPVAAAAGSYTLNVTGVSGTIAHTAQIFLTIAPGPQPYLNGYLHRRTIVINHANVANTDQTGFPVLINVTDPLLKTAANGGHVNSANGYDIVFSADPNGAGANLNYEAEQYIGATGTLTAWVNIPLLSHVTDTVVYLFYGKPNVNGSQENKPGVWDSNFVGVWHLGTAADSSSNNVNGTAGAGAKTGVAGLLGAGASFNGKGNAFIDMGISPILDMAGPFTMSAWIRKTAYTGSYEVIGSKCSGAACNYELALDGPNHDLEGVQNGAVFESGLMPSLNQWHHAVEVSDGIHLLFYIDGALAATVSAGTGTPIPGTHFNLGREQVAGENFSGTLDEARLSKAARSADWILTEFRNQSNPAAFFTLSAEQ